MLVWTHGVSDEGMTPSDTTINYKVSSFQINLPSEFENRLLPNDLIRPAVRPPQIRKVNPRLSHTFLFWYILFFLDFFVPAHFSPPAHFLATIDLIR